MRWRAPPSAQRARARVWVPAARCSTASPDNSARPTGVKPAGKRETGALRTDPMPSAARAPAAVSTATEAAVGIRDGGSHVGHDHTGEPSRVIGQDIATSARAPVQQETDDGTAEDMCLQRRVGDRRGVLVKPLLELREVDLQSREAFGRRRHWWVVIGAGCWIARRGDVALRLFVGHELSAPAPPTR